MRGRASLKSLVARHRLRNEPWDSIPREEARASMFFDAFPRFYETSETHDPYGRINLRYEAIFAQNADVFQNARVLDIASHDGRWSLAALCTGAAEVVGIEAREDLVEAARSNLDLYAPGMRYTFIAGDVFDVFATEQLQADVVLCLGFLYHTLRYSELMRRIRDLEPRYLILDTAVEGHVKRPYVRLRCEAGKRSRAAVSDRFSYDNRTLAGVPSVAALRLLLESYGFELERFSDWDSLIRGNRSLTHVSDYAKRSRVTVRCVSTN